MNCIIMKKIGILTQPLLNNYGGLLQNYALQQVLMQLGYEPETIDHGVRKQPWLNNLLVKIKVLIACWLHFGKCAHKPYQLTEKELRIISQNNNRFIDKNIKRTEKFYDNKKLDALISRGAYYGYVVGSDQCWRPSYACGFLNEMFLSFISSERDIKRIAYAASFGTDVWEFSPEKTERCARLAQKFDLITVREKSGIALCRKHLGVEAQHVLDPTMLLNKEDYIHVVEAEHAPISEGTLFHYILDPTNEKKILVDSVASKLGLIPFTVMPKFQAENRTKEDIKKRINDCVFPSVTNWLRSFMDAKMVIVDSFHGTVFSIIFNKLFWVLSNEERGNARFESLLGMFGLEDRMISVDLFNEDFNWNKSIEWERVNKIREREVARCKLLLENALN